MMAKHRTRIAVTILGGIAFLMFNIGSYEGEEEIEQDISLVDAAYEVTAQQLYSAYEANEVGADLKYKDKVLIVTGVIDDIGTDIANDLYVMLKTGEYHAYVKCSFGAAYKETVARLRKGQELRLKGKCSGKMMIVLLRGCTFMTETTTYQPNEDEEMQAEHETEEYEEQQEEQSLTASDVAEKLREIFTDEQLASIIQYRSSLAEVSDARTLLKAYRSCQRLKQDLSPSLETWYANSGEYDDWKWLNNAVPGLGCGIYGEGTIAIFEIDLEFFEKLAGGKAKPFLSYLNVLKLAYGENTSAWPLWLHRTWDYGGVTVLGNGLHLKILSAIDAALEESRLLEDELLVVRKSVLENIIKGNEYFGYADPDREIGHDVWVEKIHSELNQILDFVDLSDEERSAIRVRMQQPFPEQAAKGG
jgi:hypothetical protein